MNSKKLDGVITSFFFCFFSFFLDISYLMISQFSRNSVKFPFNKQDSKMEMLAPISMIKFIFVALTRAVTSKSGGT